VGRGGRTGSSGFLGKESDLCLEILDLPLRIERGLGGGVGRELCAAVRTGQMVRGFTKLRGN
jgi:hypothetical protein